MNDIMELMEKYNEMFGDNFPTYILGLDEDKIQECIDKGKSAEELYDLDYEDDEY